MSALEHLGCGGSLVDAVVPYCGKCGKSKPSVLKDNDKFTEQIRAATKKEEWTGPAPKKYQPEKADPDKIDHRPIRSTESKRANEAFDEITKLRYSAGGLRDEKGVWSQIHDMAKQAINMAKEDGDHFCLKKTQGILRHSEEILGEKQRETRVKKEG